MVVWDMTIAQVEGSIRFLGGERWRKPSPAPGEVLPFAV
jgi:hypothetical protein